MCEEGKTFAQFEDWQLEEIKLVANAYHLPWEFVASIIAKESSGKWEAGKAMYLGSRHDYLVPYIGMWFKEIRELGFIPERMLSDHRRQVTAICLKLANIRDKINIWELVADAHYSGFLPDFSDRRTGVSGRMYSSDVYRWMKQLGYK